jgi:hypothetical protein
MLVFKYIGCVLVYINLVLAAYPNKFTCDAANKFDCLFCACNFYTVR